MDHPIMMEAMALQFYESKRYILGDTIPVKTELDARDMEALHLAKRLKPVAAVLLPQERVMRAEDDASDSTAKAPEDKAASGTEETSAEKERTTERKRGKYGHRAMQARQ